MAQKLSKLKRLLDESLESYYWLGFLMADGHFSQSNRLTVCSAKKDSTHLEKFALYTNTKINFFNVKIKNKSYSQCEVSVMDTETISVLKNKFSISNRKTENPPNLKQLKGNKLFAFKIGFIDGDGCITNQTNRSDVSLRIKCHQAWKDNLEFLFGNAKINNQGYAQVCISDNTKIRKIKKKALDLNLPLMERKWDKVNLCSTSRCENSKSNLQKIKILLNQNISQKEICKSLNLSPSAVSLTISRNNLEYNHWTNIKKEIKILNSQGYNQREISVKLKISQSMVSRSL